VYHIIVFTVNYLFIYIITLFATSAAKKKRKKHTNTQAITTTRLYESAQNTLSELQRPVINHIATLQPVTNTEF